MTQILSSDFFSGLGSGICLAWLMSIVFNFASKREEKEIPPDIPSDDSDDEEFTGNSDDEEHYKMVLIVRNDLKMGKGKAAAQCSHAAVSAYKQASKFHPGILKIWENSGQAKVVLKIDSEDAIIELAKTAKIKGLIVSVIHDAGRTQIAPNSLTVIGVGPGPADKIDEVTGHLKLY